MEPAQGLEPIRDIIRPDPDLPVRRTQRTERVEAHGAEEDERQRQRRRRRRRLDKLEVDTFEPSSPPQSETPDR